MDQDQDPRTKPERVDEFVLAVAAKLRVAGPKSHVHAVYAAALLLGDRLHRDFGPEDIARLAEKMRDEASTELEAVLMRARFALPIDRYQRAVDMG